MSAPNYPVMEHFYTLQGEGFHAGTSAYFIRLGGCDVGCHWCDVKESWPADQHPAVSVEELASAVAASAARIIVITGGEPLMYPMEEWLKPLKTLKKPIHVETSGAHPLTGAFDWICFSPKKFKAPQPEFYEQAHELKVVVFHPSDLEWAQGHATRMHADAALFLQPEWSKRETIVPLIIEYIKAHPEWRISLQSHKYLNIP